MLLLKTLSIISNCTYGSNITELILELVNGVADHSDIIACSYSHLLFNEPPWSF